VLARRPGDLVGEAIGTIGGSADGSGPLKRDEKVDLGLLATPTFALALAITIVSTQLGEVTRQYTHQTTLNGAIIGGEGVMALWVPLIFGSWSDILRTRIGGRRPQGDDRAVLPRRHPRGAHRVAALRRDRRRSDRAVAAPERGERPAGWSPRSPG
jgi:hypothetical protein